MFYNFFVKQGTPTISVYLNSTRNYNETKPGWFGIRTRCENALFSLISVHRSRPDNYESRVSFVLSRKSLEKFVYEFLAESDRERDAV